MKRGTGQALSLSNIILQLHDSFPVWNCFIKLVNFPATLPGPEDYILEHIRYLPELILKV